MMDADTFYGLYRRLPIPLQNVACNAYALKQVRSRFGPEFDRNVRSLLDSEWWTGADIAAFQDAEVAAVVAYAYDRVPFYGNAMRARRLKPRDIRSVADLGKLPIVTKEELRAAPQQFRAAGVRPNELAFRHTSGTTGKALGFFVHRRVTAFQWAVWWRHRLRFGLRTTDYHANFTGKVVVPPEQGSPPYWRSATPMHQVVVGMQHVTPGKASDIVRMLNNERFVFFSGYPSIIHALARHALDQQLTLLPGSRPRVIVMGAENILAHQRRDIEAWTGATVTDQYGFSEACGNASPCLCGRYHEDFEFGVLECVPDGQEVAEGDRGRIVCTGFLSKEYPFIRYEVGDVGVWYPKEDRCSCGRQSRGLAYIDGRVDDCVITPEGHRVMRFDYIFKDTAAVRECQVVQEQLGSVIFRIVRRGDYSLKDEATIRELVKRYISESIVVEFEYPSELPRTAAGKLTAVVSALAKPKSGAR